MTIAYLHVKESNRIFIGGIMVTDEFGIPKEFKYSEPVKPTKLQVILYGKVLSKYIKIEVLTKNLLTKLDNNPEILFTHDMEIATSEEIENEVLYISTISAENMKKDIERIDESEISIKTSSFKGYRIVSKKDPLNYVEKIKELSKTMDLDEPFNRMEEALNYVINENSEKGK